MAKKVDEVKDVVNVEDKVESQEPQIVVKKRVFDLNEEVEVMNNTFNTLFFKNERNLNTIEIREYGGTDVLTLGDLKTLRARGSRMIDEGWLVILDDEVVDYLHLTDKYQYIIKPNEVDGFLKMSEDKIVEILDKAPKGVKETIAKVVNDKVENNQFDSISKLNAIKKVLKIEDEI